MRGLGFEIAFLLHKTATVLYILYIIPSENYPSISDIASCELFSINQHL